MEIRVAVPGDEPSIVTLVNHLIAELGGESLPSEAAEKSARSFISGENKGTILVASDGNDLVAVCTLTYQPAIRSLGDYAIIQEMYVSPSHRNSNLGSQIIEFAKNEAAKDGCALIELSTPPEGENAERFYRNNGFSQVGVRMRHRI